ncbi:MAG: hypothetical protein GC137_06330 [Alphaproteobacteria bacterium]|nr:hypothetical protein [Alphaproteobacteria bacterium]
MSAIERLADPTDQLVLDHFGLVERISRKFKVSADVREELEGEGYYALVQAARNDTYGGIPQAFNAYARRYIKGAMVNHLRQRRLEQNRRSPKDPNEMHSPQEISELNFLTKGLEIDSIRDFLATIAFMARLTKEEVKLLKDDIPLSKTEDEKFPAKARAVEKVRRAIDKHGSYLSENEIEYSTSFLQHHQVSTNIILQEDVIECAKLHKQYTEGHRYPAAKSETHNEIRYGILVGMKWSQIDHALKVGLYGLPAVGGLNKFLKNQQLNNTYNAADILESAALHKRRTGKYPSQISGDIFDGPLKGRTWASVDKALRSGYQNFKGGSSLAEFLAENGMTNDITQEQILECARLHQQNSKNGKYPTMLSGEIQWGSLKGTDWNTINNRLMHGQCGLPGGDTLAQLLQRHGLTNDITEDQILECMKLHKLNSPEKRYPVIDSGKIQWGSLKGRDWANIHQALYSGYYGLPGGSSLDKFKKKHGLIDQIPSEDILDALIREKLKSGKLPAARTDIIIDEGSLRGKSWKAIDSAFWEGNVEGWPKKSSLAKFKIAYMDWIVSQTEGPELLQPAI